MRRASSKYADNFVDFRRMKEWSRQNDVVFLVFAKPLKGLQILLFITKLHQTFIVFNVINLRWNSPYEDCGKVKLAGWYSSWRTKSSCSEIKLEPCDRGSKSLISLKDGMTLSKLPRILRTPSMFPRLKVFRAISQSHDDHEAIHRKQIYRLMEYTFLEYFLFYLVNLFFLAPIL